MTEVEKHLLDGNIVEVQFNHGEPVTGAIVETSPYGLLLYLGVEQGRGRERILVPWLSIRLVQSSNEVILPSAKVKLDPLARILKDVRPRDVNDS